jgi:hypothetical protein
MPQPTDQFAHLALLRPRRARVGEHERLADHAEEERLGERGDAFGRRGGLACVAASIGRILGALRPPVEHGECGGVDLVLLRERGLLEVPGVGQRHLRHPDAPDRGVEIVEAGGLDAGG